MTAHVKVLAIYPDWPAASNPQISQTQLRKELGFSALIVSDDLRMNAISDYCGVAKRATSAAVDQGQNPTDVSVDSYLRMAACDALTAGCDILRSCQSIAREKTVLLAVKQLLAQRKDDESWFLGARGA